MAISQAVANAILGQRTPDIMGAFEQGQETAFKREERGRARQIQELSGQAYKGDAGAFNELQDMAPEVALKLQNALGAKDKDALGRLYTDAKTALSIYEDYGVEGVISFGENRMKGLKSMFADTQDTERALNFFKTGNIEEGVANLKATVSAFDQANGMGSQSTSRQKEWAQFEAMPENTEQERKLKKEYGQLVGIVGEDGGATETAKLVEFNKWESMADGPQKDALARVIGITPRTGEGEGKLSPGLEKVMFEAQDNELQSGARVRELEALANDFTNDLASGAASNLSEVFKNISGTQDGATEIRRRLQKVRLSQALTLLPPGPATDKDVEEAMKGVPRDNASPGQVRSFLMGAAKISRLDEAYNRFKARYISDEKTGTGMNRAFRQAIKDGLIPEYQGVIKDGVDGTGSGTVDDLVNKYAN